MRLSEWRKRAPSKDSVSPKVQSVVDPALAMLGAPGDPDCWVVWGDDPGVRYMILAPTQSGLIQLNVRVNVAGEGPRASGKVVRWARVQLGELGLEMQGGHRLISFQVETQVLNGADAAADAIAGFAHALFAAVDGRPVPASWSGPARRPGTGAPRAGTATGTGKAAVTAKAAAAATATKALTTRAGAKAPAAAATATTPATSARKANPATLRTGDTTPRRAAQKGT